MRNNNQIEEIRIYYESLEQGANYIKPLIDKYLVKKNISVKLVNLKGSYKYYSKKIAPLIFWKDPDILVSIISNGEEYPIFMLEFSNAVFTEDHELQRFDGLVAAAENNCIYVKISPLNKTSISDHGGNVNFDYIGPFSLILSKYKRMFYHFDWECNKEGVVIVDDQYLSCPKKIPDFDYFIDKVIDKITGTFKEESWIRELEESLISKEYFKEWRDKLKNFSLPKIEKLNTSRTQWINHSKELILKLNRFGHAMDPERGMLSYYGTLYPRIVSKMLFNSSNLAWYKDTPKEREITNYINSHGLKRAYDFLYCFMLGSGLYMNKDFKSIVSNLQDNKEDYLEIDLTHFLSKNYLFLNKAMRTIFKKSIYFVIVDNFGKEKIKLIWDSFLTKETYKSFPKSTNINLRETLDEDSVTYICVHNVLKENKHRILNVSYPGAQGDRVILIEAGTGRAQKRRYIDIISYLPKKYTSLQENKGKFSRREIQKEITELTKYKSEASYKQGIKAFIKRFDKEAPEITKIGVGFWANPNFTISDVKNLEMKDLDYFIYISTDKKYWTIWSTGEGRLFSTTKGKINLPTTYELSNPK
jgi:hypothetical protein